MAYSCNGMAGPDFPDYENECGGLPTSIPTTTVAQTPSGLNLLLVGMGLDPNDVHRQDIEPTRFSTDGGVLADTCETVGFGNVGREGAVSGVLPGGRLIVCGGMSGGQVLDDCASYNAVSGRWESEPSLPEALYNSASMVNDFGELIVIGGQTSEDTFSSSVYVLRDGDWVNGPSLANPTTLACATPIFGGARTFLVGGQTREVGALNAAWELDWNDEGSGWRRVSSEGLARRAHGCATFQNGGAVLVTGGSDANGQMTDLTEIYDVGDDEWLVGPTLPEAREGLKLVTDPVADTVLAVGGRGPIPSQIR